MSNVRSLRARLKKPTLTNEERDLILAALIEAVADLQDEAEARRVAKTSRNGTSPVERWFLPDPDKAPK